MTLSIVAVNVWLALAAQDPAALEQRAKEIEARLIAPCCWSQQVSLHQSPAADEVKKAVRLMLAEGRTTEQILDSYVAQYGDRILAEPPAKGFNLLLYVGPWVFLAGSIVLVVVVIRRLRVPASKSADGRAVPVDEAEAERIDEELRNLD